MINNSFLRFKKNVKSKYLDEDIINLMSANFVIPQDFTYQLVRIPKSMVARPDLISLATYNDASYADLICKLNGISNMFELNEDDVIVIPTYDYIEKFYRVDNYDDTVGIDKKTFIDFHYKDDEEKNDESIKMKLMNKEAEDNKEPNEGNKVVLNKNKKNEKRRPNQAKPDDVRYRVDKNRRVVVY